MEYGLDIGPTAIRAATDTGDGPTIDSIPPVVLPVDDDTLETAGLSEADAIVRVDGTAYAVGTAARVAANVVDEEPQSLFAPDSSMLETEATTRAILNALVGDVIGDVTDGRLCYATADAGGDTAPPTDTPHETVASVLADRGLDATPLSKGFAVVYDQLAADNYTGLGVCLEAQTTSVSLAYYGVPAMAVSIAKGREWIVDRVADETEHTRPQVVDALETLTLDPDATTDDLESAIAEAYDALVTDVIEAVEAEADETDVQRGVSVPVAIAGGGTIEGLEFLVGGRFDAAGVPFSIRNVQLADTPAESAVRGALAAARDDIEADETITRADSVAESTNSGTPTTDPTTGGEQPAETELAFDEFAVEEAATDRTNDAIDQLFARLGTRDDEIQSVRDDLDSVLEELADGQTRTAAAEDVAELDDELATLSDALAAVNDDIEDIDRTIATVEETTADERAALEERLDAVAADVETVTNRTATVDEAVGELRAELETLEETTVTETALAELEQTITALESELEALEQNADQRGSHLDDIADRLEALQARLDGVSGRLEEESELTATRVDTLETSVERLDAESVTDDELTALRDSLAAVHDETESVAAAVDDVETSLETVSDRLDDLTGELEDRITDVQTSLERRIDDVETALEKDVTALEADIERETDSLADTVSAIDERTAETERRLDDHHDRIDALASTTDTVDDDIADIDSTLESLRTDHEQLAQTVASGPGEETIQALESELEIVDERLSEIAEQHANLEEAIDTVDARVHDIETQDDPDEALEALRTDLDDVRADARATPGLSSSIAAGGGAAGVVAGAVTAIAGNGAIGAGAAIVGLVLVGVAMTLARGQGVDDV